MHDLVAAVLRTSREMGRVQDCRWNADLRVTAASLCTLSFDGLEYAGEPGMQVAIFRWHREIMRMSAHSVLDVGADSSKGQHKVRAAVRLTKNQWQGRRRRSTGAMGLGGDIRRRCTPSRVRL